MKYGLLLFSLVFSVNCSSPKVPASPPEGDSGEEEPDDDVGVDDEGEPEKEGIVFGPVRIQPEEFDFGEVELGSPGVDAWSITNDSADSTTISTVFVEGTGFNLGSGNTFPIELASGETLSGTVLFSPPASGPFSGKINIGISGEAGYGEVVLKGSGVEEGTIVTDDTGEPTSLGELEVFPESLDFGPYAVGETSWKTLQLTNTGDSDVLITQLSTSNNFVFLVESDPLPPLSLSVGHTHTVQVGFRPLELIDYADEFEIEANIEGEKIGVPLTGAGSDEGCTTCAPVISTYTSSGSSESLFLTPPSGMGCTANGSVVVTNTGDLPLNVTDVFINNDSISTCGDFSRSWLGSLSLEPGVSTTIGIDYVATSACMESAYPETDQNVLHILSSDPDTPDQTVLLEGDALYCGG